MWENQTIKLTVKKWKIFLTVKFNPNLIRPWEKDEKAGLCKLTKGKKM